MASEPNHKGKPWPEYFIVRPAGEIVPLIPLDELPPDIEVVGVPRSLQIQETIGMENLGLQRATGAQHQLVWQEMNEGPGNSNSKKKLQNTLPSPPSTLKAALAAPSTISNSTPLSAPKDRSHARHAVPDLETIRCRHWCHHGICKWGQECRYKHDMPMSLLGLQEVGLADWPFWFKKLNPGYFVGRGQAVSARPRTRICSAGTGHGVACCGTLHPGKSDKRLRSRGLGDRGIGGTATDTLGEQIINRLRGMGREGSLSVGEKGNMLVEQAAARTTRDWDEISEDSLGGSTQALQIDEPKGELVDV